VSEDLVVTLGLRAERVDYDYDNRMISGRTKDDGTACGFGGCRYNRPESRSDAFNNLSPKLGFNYAFGQHRLFGQLSKGFRAPQATELYRLQNGQNVADIDSEALDSLEVGLRGATARLSYQLTSFSMKKEGFIFQDTTRANVDNGETRHQGVEIEGRFALRDNLEVSANWTLARHRYDNNPALSRGVIQGNDIDTAPRSMGGLQVNWALTERVTSELEWVHIGPYFTNPDNTNRYEGHDLINLRANLALTNVWQGFLRVTNLLDTDYAERADYAFGNERFFVGEPRGVYIGFRRSN
ncbi:TonB-dependent receptor, partial [Pseudomonadales bacterium]|nr:TonB-dependent receptor [Pseudomonadales bacterium]